MNITIKKASNKDDIVLDAIEAYKLIYEMMDIGKKKSRKPDIQRISSAITIATSTGTRTELYISF